ncbi:TPA: C40 family peptidase [Citrobacter sedlakii]|nr:C40 family peptidase [Citrobacter sedlakii]HCA7081536.1 C40 family peptidase [Citrobacter sedlakii]HCA7134894.1 C40 family peptidase [Citrobacter sedlakii]HCA7138113.1 C40 family peptidase [Citrobacter sedlakii]HCA7180862.1 C40 family peptidase [Citrobacter sedlakii]
MFFPLVPRVVLTGVLTLSVALSPLTVHAAHRSITHHSYSYGAKQRMKNRAKLLKQYQAKMTRMAHYVIKGDAHSKRALRQHNRELIEQHPEWFPGPFKANDRRWRQLAENKHFLSSDHLHNITEVAIHRLEEQLGKPYVWGGINPDVGFDCSGLVFFAYNQILATKLPRTANQMFHYKRATIVSNRDLRRGDLLFFHIHSEEIADHMGVYLGDGEFIQSPRTGETVRVSHLNEPFWQDHFLGARRILQENTIL